MQMGSDFQTADFRTAKQFQHGAIASPHHLASQVGLDVLRTGGNAIDAAVAMNLTLGVVAPYLCGYGGDLFAIIWDGTLHGYAGAGRSGRNATIESVLAGSPTLPDTDPKMPAFGPHSVTVPGAVAGWFDLLERFGTRTFQDLAAPARQYARDGFIPSEQGASQLAGLAFLYEDFPEWQAVYAGATALTLFTQPALADTIDCLASEGPDFFYRGPIAAAISHAVTLAGGHLSNEDLAAHVGSWPEPLRGTYRSHQIVELPPPTQGVTVLEALAILERFDLPEQGPARQHLLIEAVKLSLADRDEHVGDPAAMGVKPEDLVSPSHISERAALIDLYRAQTPGPSRPQPGGTAYLCAADNQGNCISLIQSNFLAFGSGIHVPAWGINLHNRGFSFSLESGRVNSLAPNKLPLHTLIPAMVLQDGRPSLVFGTMGGDGQAQTQVQLLARILDDGQDIAAAIDAPRWRVDLADRWRLDVETRFAPQIVEGLKSRGHRVNLTSALDMGMGHAHAISITAPKSSGTPSAVMRYSAASDCRTEGAALGY